MAKNKGQGGGQKAPATGFQSTMAVDTMSQDNVPLRQKYAGGVKAMIGGFIAITGMHFLDKAIDKLFGVSADTGDMVPKSVIEGKDKYIASLKAQLEEARSGDADDESND